jgi:hypothetical protein
MSNPISAPTRARFGASIVALAPAVILAGLFAHPYIATLPDEAAIAEAVAADKTWWGLVHLTAGVASGLMVLAFFALRSYLREAGEERWSILALPFIVVGSTLFTELPGMEFAPLAASEAGADVQAVQVALPPWFLPILMTGAATFAIGVFAFAKGIADSRVLSRRLSSVGEVGTQSVTLHSARLEFHLEEPTLLGVLGLNLHFLPVTAALQHHALVQRPRVRNRI